MFSRIGDLVNLGKKVSQSSENAGGVDILVGAAVIGAMGAGVVANTFGLPIGAAVISGGFATAKTTSTS